ncbi:MAG: type VI secretion system contractile sheath large subunit, partial [Rubrivivax sp.]
MPDVPTEGLRQAVLAGRFLGAVPAAADVAALVAGSDMRAHLRLWFGLDALVSLAGQPEPAAALRAALDRDIATLDAMLSTQLDAVLHHPRMRRLEGSWRGLQWLVER